MGWVGMGAGGRCDLVCMLSVSFCGHALVSLRLWFRSCIISFGSPGSWLSHHRKCEIGERERRWFTPRLC